MDIFLYIGVFLYVGGFVALSLSPIKKRLNNLWDLVGWEGVHGALLGKGSINDQIFGENGLEERVKRLEQRVKALEKE